MEFNRLHWTILQEIGRDFADKVREFLVIGNGGEGVLMVTEPDGEGYWFGEMKFGLGDFKKATKPTRLGVSNLVRMAHGSTHIVLLDGMGQIYTLGRNDRGQLGQGTVDDTINFTPQPIASPHRFTEVRCGEWYSLALTEDGKVWAWGNNSYCQVGLPSSTSSIPSPRQISELNSHRVVAIECGGLHSLALTDQGQVYGWGDKHYGQLAQSGLSPQPTPVLLPSACPVIQIAAGFWHTLLLAKDGGVFACGLNNSGQLGLPISSTEAKSTLCKVSGLPPISRIASHFDTNLSIALSTDRRCFVWGGCGQVKYPTPLQLPPIYSTIESPLSSWSTRRNTPHSVRIEVSKSFLTSDSGTQTDTLAAPDSLTSDSGTQTDALTAQDSLQDRVSSMFDNPDSELDLQFVLREKSILAHRAVFQLSTANFTGLFPESPQCRPVDLSPTSPKTSLPQPTPTSTRHTTNPTEPDTTQINPTTTSHLSPDIIRFPDHSYPVFLSFVRYIYTGLFQVPVDLLPDLFELSLSFQFSDMQQLCHTRMLSTVSLSTCCPYYQLADRHQLSEIQTQVVKFTAENLVLVLRTEAFRSMDPELARKLTLAASDLEPQAIS